MVALHWIKDEGVQMLGVPSWAWAVIIGLAYFNYFFFKYAHKLRVQIQESRTEIAKLRAEGVVIRNDGLEPFLSDRSFNEWSTKVTDWNERTKEALKKHSEADSIWFATLDTVPIDPRVAVKAHVLQQVYPYRKDHYKLLREHDKRLDNLGKMIRDLWGITDRDEQR